MFIINVFTSCAGANSQDFIINPPTLGSAETSHNIFLLINSNDLIKCNLQIYLCSKLTVKK